MKYLVFYALLAFHASLVSLVADPPAPANYVWAPSECGKAAIHFTVIDGGVVRAQISFNAVVFEPSRVTVSFAGKSKTDLWMVTPDGQFLTFPADGVEIRDAGRVVVVVNGQAAEFDLSKLR